MNKKALVTTTCLVLLAMLLIGCARWPSEDQDGPASTPLCEQPNGIGYVSLGRQGNGIYNTEVSDPRAWCSPPHAIITKVTNDSGNDISLAHGGPGSNYIILNSGDSTDVFNGQLVEGFWSAQRGGPVAGEPLQITIKAEWKKP